MISFVDFQVVIDYDNAKLNLLYDLIAVKSIPRPYYAKQYETKTQVENNSD